MDVIGNCSTWGRYSPYEIVSRGLSPPGESMKPTVEIGANGALSPRWAWGRSTDTLTCPLDTRIS